MKRAEKTQRSQKLLQHYGPTSHGRGRRTATRQRGGDKGGGLCSWLTLDSWGSSVSQCIHAGKKKCGLFSSQVLHPSPSPHCSVSESMRVNSCCHVVLSLALLLGNPRTFRIVLQEACCQCHEKCSGSREVSLALGICFRGKFRRVFPMYQLYVFPMYS